MASPNFDSLNVQVSRNIGYAVSTATTDNIITSAQRDTYLNNAIRRFIRDVVEKGGEDYRPIEQYVKESPSVALATNLISLTSASFTGGNIDTVISVVNVASGTVFVKKIPLSMVHVSNASVNFYITASSTNQYWYVENGNLYVLGSGATDNIKVRYITRHTALSANGASDILIDSQYWNAILDLATKEFLLDRPSEQNVVRSKLMAQS